MPGESQRTISLDYGELGGEDGELSGELAARFDAQGPYKMQLVGEDAAAFTAAVNQGIDSRLTAMTGFKADWVEHKVGGKVLVVKLHCEVPPKDMRVLLRRLAEGTDEQLSLASAILGTVNVEWV